MNAKWLIAAAFALPVAAYAGGDKASSASTGTGAAASATGGTASASASSDGSAMFKQLDKNNDGFISREEAKGSPHEKDFDKLDKNHDGKLSKDEHAAAHKAQAGTGGTKSESGSGSAAATSSAPMASPSQPTVSPSQSSSERTAEPLPHTPAAPTGEKKY